MTYLLWLVWLGAVVLFVLAEAATAQLVSIWFALGAVAALLAALLRVKFVGQFWTFILVSAIALAAVRPLAFRRGRDRVVHTNADRVLDVAGRVTETVDADGGIVYADGKSWSARSADGEVIPVGTRVRVERMEGVRLFVRPFPEQAVL